MLTRYHGFIVLSLLCLNLSATNYEHPAVNKEAQVGLNSVTSARSLGATRIVISAGMDFSYDKNLVPLLLVKDSETGIYDSMMPASTLIDFYPGIAYGLTNFIDLSLALPVYADIIPKFSPQGAFGDLKFISKFRLPLDNNGLFNAALLTSMIFPTGHKKTGFFPRHSYYFEKKYFEDSVSVPAAYFTTKSLSFDLEALWTLDMNWLLLYLNTGCVLNVNRELDNAAVVKGAIELRPNSRVGFFTELSAEPRFYNMSHGFKIADDPIWLSPGVTFTSSMGAMVTLKADLKLSSNKYIEHYDIKDQKRFTSKIIPAWRIGLQLGWSSSIVAQDADNDLVLDKDDKCPHEQEDLDGFDDADGCPDYDNDKDGIPDSLDKCPNEMEDFDNVDDLDGCPDFDNDKDGIADSLDKCVSAPEDFDGFQDNDGCPDFDNDGDGIPDSIDKCISLPEDKDGFEDMDGCPDLDNDLDGIVDSLDKCPDVAGVKEEEGCQSKSKSNAKEIKRGRVILSGVAFEPGTAILVQSAYILLDQLYESLSTFLEVNLEIKSYMDNSGYYDDTMILTQKRATAIRDYLVGRGVSAERLTAVGKGDSDPIGDNETIPGRQLNNRIEIFRID
jgi:outer membrane protein OmpA-like peptidoglycan-associated protein